MSTPIAEVLSFYGEPSTAEALPWPWVADQLATAGTYWVDLRAGGAPHPRPVWGIWHDDRLMLSLGSPVVHRRLLVDPNVAVHLGSGVDVVIVEGTAAEAGIDADALAAYNTKYDWQYDLAQYGPLTVVTPSVVLAWRAAGVNGRDGFQQAARWRFA